MTKKEIRRADTSKSVAALQYVWLKALDRPDGLRFVCEGGEQAHRLRAKLYNAVRNVKKFPEEFPELVEAVRECELVLEGAVVIVRQKALSPEMMGLRKQLEAQGVAMPESVLDVTPVEREAQASADRMLERLFAEGVEIGPAPTGGSAAPEVKNPFYTRE